MTEQFSLQMASRKIGDGWKHDNILRRAVRRTSKRYVECWSCWIVSELRSASKYRIDQVSNVYKFDEKTFTFPLR